MKRLAVIWLTVVLLLVINCSYSQERRGFPEVNPQLATADCKLMKDGWIVLYHIEIRDGIFAQKKRKPAVFVETGGNVHNGKWREKGGAVLVDWDTGNSSWRFRLDKHASYEKQSFYPCRA